MSRITLCGRDRPLRFSLNALCMLEEESGCGLDALLRRPLSGVRGLIWCGLKEEEPSLTLKEAGEMLARHLREGGSLEGLSRALADALEEAGFFQMPGRESGKETKA